MKTTQRNTRQRTFRFKDPDGRKHVLRIVHTAKCPERPEDTYDPERDWAAWKQTLEERERGWFTPSPTPIPSKEAIGAAQAAARGTDGGGPPDARIDAPSLQRAAALTTYFSKMELMYSEIKPYRWDLLIAALNCYPHPISAACRWLVPALRNFLGEPRETPDDLWTEWSHEQRRLFRLTLHPDSILFVDRRPRHQLVDLETCASASSRTQLEIWRLRAHLMQVPKISESESGFHIGSRPLLDVGRLNALTRYAVEMISATIFSKADIEPIAESLRTFLLRRAGAESTPMSVKQRFKQSLMALNKAVLYGLVRRGTFRLEHRHVREYDTLLRGVQMVWNRTERLPLDKQQKARHDSLIQSGWKDSEQTGRFLEGLLVGDCLPREVAALLLCMREGLGLHHPQTIFEKLAEARKIYSGLSPGEPKRKRRGRPPKPREFSPTTPDTD